MNDRINTLTEYLIEELRGIPKVRIIGPAEASKRAGVVGIYIEGRSIRETAQYLNEQNVGMMGHHFFLPGDPKIIQNRRSCKTFSALLEYRGRNRLCCRTFKKMAKGCMR